MRGAGGAHAPRLSPPGGSLRPEPGIESGRHQRKAVDFRPPRTSSSSRRCGGRVHSPEAVVRALCRLGWQGCARANDLTTSSRRRMRAAPSRSACGETPRLAAIPSHGSLNKACICPRAARPPLPPHRASAPRAARTSVLHLPPLHALHPRPLRHLRVFSHPTGHAQRLFGSKNEQDEEGAHSHPPEAQCCYNRTIA